MTLFDLALKNIRRNMKSYSLYLGSMVFSICIYFTFVTLKFSDDFADGGSMISTLMNVSSVMLIIFVAIFIAYSNSFFMKKRKKEVGLYSLLGVRKKQIGFLLFFENMVIGMFSLIVGILLGFFASKGILAILIQLMNLDIVSSFTFSGEAVRQTMLLFMIIFFLTSLQGYFVIYQFKLIDLFHAEKKGEALPKAKAIAAILGVAMIGAGYYLASVDMSTSQAWKMLGIITTPLIIVLLVVFGTYLLFHSVTVFILSKMKKNSHFAWRGLNLMTVSQMLYRIRGNAKTLTLIAILSATTITAGGAVFGLYYNIGKEAQKYAPNTFMWQGNSVNIQSDAIIYNENIEVKNSDLNIYNDVYNYAFIKLSQYNKMASLQGKEALTLLGNDAFIMDSFYDARFSDDYTGKTMQVGEQTFTIESFSDESMFNTPSLFVVAVVTDDAYEAIQGEAVSYQMVEMKDEKNQLAVSEKIREQIGESETFSSHPAIYQSMVQSYGALLFAGSFLGLVFLMAMGSVIYFKMITDAEEDRGKYEVLFKIGVNSKEMKKTIRAQVGLIFGIPLILGILHSVFALKAFSTLFNMNIVTPVLIWIVVYSAIYGLYYILTVSYFNKVIRQKL
ncbi:FtsX-like permease family protein [Solibacillus daqui]|uniref:FtsX-like permease family protein n=1 Tax=Solibacillus daqui TaxID=2912187 RepID=UPI0023670BEF|nr:ABC transporter permease [Solibacillus daqui]